MSRIYSVEDLRVETLIVIPESPPVISVSASGWVPTSGWTHAELAPWMYISPPKDGVLDLDFVATAPTGIVLQVYSKVGVVKTFQVPDWVVGVRVHTSTNEMQAAINGAKNPTDASLMGEGLPLPWPFPWWAPKCKRQ